MMKLVHLLQVEGMSKIYISDIVLIVHFFSPLLKNQSSSEDELPDIPDDDKNEGPLVNRLGLNTNSVN